MNKNNMKEFLDITGDLIKNPVVLQMKNYRQHYNTSCYDHCIEVAYWSYILCKKLNLDYEKKREEKSMKKYLSSLKK